jgi:hypothetical protein
LIESNKNYLIKYTCLNLDKFAYILYTLIILFFREMNDIDFYLRNLETLVHEISKNVIIKDDEVLKELNEKFNEYN